MIHYEGLKYHLRDALIEKNLNPDTAVNDPPFAIFAKSYYDKINNLNHLKSNDFCFIGSINSAPMSRMWIFNFVKKHFTYKSIFINTDIMPGNQWASLGSFDLSGQGLGYCPKTHYDNQSRDAQWRDITQNNFYFLSMCQSKYVLCPGGDSPWSFRFYECLMCKAMPIVETWHHTYRTIEEARIKYKYILQDSFIDNDYTEDINENSALFERWHMLQ